MSAVIFALLLVATALGLERYSTVHSLDDVQGRLEVEDHLVEAGDSPSRLWSATSTTCTTSSTIRR